MKQHMIYICRKCGENAVCEHGYPYMKPCYSDRKAGLWVICNYCCWKFVCATGSDLLEAEYQASLAREEKRKRRCNLLGMVGVRKTS